MEHSEVCMEKIKRQHEQLKMAFEELGLKVAMMETDEKLPDCVFVEDPVVVVGKKAILTTTGHASRRNEKSAMKAQLDNIKGLQIAEMSEINKEAKLDGGDVLFTGKEMFIGLSTRTNVEAVEVMRNYFSDVIIHSVEVSEELHLKSCMTLAGRRTILASVGTQATRDVLKKFKEAAKESYKFIELDSLPARCNVVYFEVDKTSVVLHTPMTSDKEIEALKQINVDKKIELDFDEFGKVDGCLTCCCVLISL